MSNENGNNPENTQELQIQVPQEEHRGSYANQFVVAHTPEEFILDFILATPPVGIVNSRVLVSPAHAKRIVSTLQENIVRYESIFGEIEAKAAIPMPENNQTH